MEGQDNHNKNVTGVKRKFIKLNNLPDSVRLQLKRFKDDDPILTAATKRMNQKYPGDALIELAKTSRATCRCCKEQINKDDYQLVLHVQCYRGCKNRWPIHLSCVKGFKECGKIDSIDEIANVDEILDEKMKVKLEIDLKNSKLF